MNENDVLDTEQLVQNDNEFSEPSEDAFEDVSLELAEPDISDPDAEQSEVEGSEISSEVIQIVDFPFSEENPLPVTLVEEEVVEEENELEVFALTGKFYGTISDSYLDYFEGIVQKLSPDEHYVVWRSGQYAYEMAYGEDITLEGNYFSGDCNNVSIYRNSNNMNTDWYVDYGTDSLSLNATQLFVYSDLGDYPMLERGGTYGTDMALLVAVCVCTAFVLAHSIFDYIVKYVYKR